MKNLNRWNLAKGNIFILKESVSYSAKFDIWNLLHVPISSQYPSTSKLF